MIRGLINLTLLLFSYETKFLTSCYSKDNICQIWAFLSERKSNVLRGQNSLSSAQVSAAVIYWDARGSQTLWVTTCVRNPCPHQLIKMSWNTRGPSLQGEPHSLHQGYMKCAHRRKKEQAMLAKVEFPIVWRGAEYTLQSSPRLHLIILSSRFSTSC